MALRDIVKRRQRLQRSELAVPATSERFFLKAAASAVDAVFIDLEDAVTDTRKVEARRHAIRAINDIEWRGKTISVRVNALDTPWALNDIVDIASHCPRLDMIMLPKASSAFDVQFVAQLLHFVEAEHIRESRIGIEVLIESSQGVANVEMIAASSDRLEAMIFGVGDYTVDLRTFDTNFGTTSANYAILTSPDVAGARHYHWNDQWHFALARIANACHANGLRAIDGPYTDFTDIEGYRASAIKSTALGFEGKWAIHPSQVLIANEVYSPNQIQRTWADNVLEGLHHAAQQGDGAYAENGVLIDLAHAKLARSIQERASLIAQQASPALEKSTSGAHK